MYLKRNIDMKFNQLILAVALFFSVTGVQSAQAGFWDYATSPFKSLASYVWNNCLPITKGGLEKVIAAKEVEYKEEADNDILIENRRKKATDAQIATINEKCDVLEGQASTLNATALRLKENADKLKEEMDAQEKARIDNEKNSNAQAKRLALEVAALAVARAGLQDSLAKIVKRVTSHDEQIAILNKKDGKSEVRYALIEQQVDKQGVQLSRIRAMLQPEKRTFDLNSGNTASSKH